MLLVVYSHWLFMGVWVWEILHFLVSLNLLMVLLVLGLAVLWSMMHCFLFSLLSGALDFCLLLHLTGMTHDLTNSEQRKEGVRYTNMTYD